MTLNVVNVTFTEQDAGGGIGSGPLVIAPTGTVVAAGQTVVSAQPVTRQLSGTLTVPLVANDNAGTTPAAGFWAYNIQLPGQQLPQTYLVNFANGANQQFSNLTPVIAQTTYGPAAGSGGFQNPMTTLGDTIYENATPAAGRLPGPTAGSAPYVYTSTPSGGVAQAPAWSPFLDTTATDIQPIGTQAAGSTGKAADAGHVHPRQPWQVSVDSAAYGAKGDGKVIGDATISGGALSTLTSASAGFTAGDTGKYIMINGGQGNNAQPLITTITYVNATTVTLAHAASGAVTNASAVYGTDDTAAVQSAVTAAGTYAMAAGAPFHAQVIFGGKIYCLATPPPVTSGIAGSTTCQIRIPAPASSGATQKLIIDLIGVGSADANMYWETAVPDIRGTALVSMCIPPFTSGTNPFPSVVGYQYADDGSLIGGFANTKVFVDGITTVIPFLGPQGAWDFRFLGGAGGGSFSAMAFGAPVNGAYNNLVNLNNLAGQQGGSSVGLFMPLTGNNDDCQVFSFANQGFTFGVNITEHCNFQRLSSVYDIVGIQCVGGGAHGNWIGYASVEAAFSAVQYTGSSPFPLVIGILDCEQVTGYHIQDTQNALYGAVLVHTNSGAPGVLGGVNMKVFSDRLGPGVWTGAPAAPSTGVAQQNTAWRDAAVWVTSTAAITAVAVDGNTVFSGSLASGAPFPVRVPAGHSYTVTSAGGTLTTHWVLD